MEHGENGVHGIHVRCLVEERTKVEQDNVTILHHNLEVTTAQLTDLLIRKVKDAMKIPVQVINFFRLDTCFSLLNTYVKDSRYLAISKNLSVFSRSINYGNPVL